MWETWVRSLVQEDPLEKEMATHSSILSWRVPWSACWSTPVSRFISNSQPVDQPLSAAGLAPVSQLISNSPTQWNWLEPLYLFIFGCENLCPVLKSSSGYTNHINYQAKTKDHGNKTANDRRPRSSSPQVLLAINMVELKMSMPSGQDAALRGHFLIFFSPCFHASSGYW